MAALLDLNPLAYALYMNAKAVCDQYGRLPGSPVKFASLVCPMSRKVGLPKIAKAMQDMASVRATDGSLLVRLYEVGGDTYLEIVDYNKIDETDWRNVGKPEYPAPPDWQPPRDLILFIAEATDGQGDKKSRIYPERYGLTREEFARLSAEYRPTVARPSPDDPAMIAGASNADTDTESKAVTSKEEARADADAPGAAPTDTAPPLGTPADDERPTTSGWQIPPDFAAQLQNYPAIGQYLSETFDWTRARRDEWHYKAAKELAGIAGQKAGATEDGFLAFLADTPPTESSRGNWCAEAYVKSLQRQQNGKPRASPQSGRVLPLRDFGEARKA